ncbi:MAG TPA: hypothetical protein VKX39_05840 [Bryobacteraceae bacterium]|jgi:hypothetical protein|nr:hypothetical protein [Bryobacteraceae bacterium]
MGESYRPYYPDEDLLLPPSLRDWLPKDHLAYFVSDVGRNIDVAGSTSSLDLPTTPGTMQSSTIVPPWNSFAPAGFVAQFAPDGISLKWASYVMSSERLGALSELRRRH